MISDLIKKYIASFVHSDHLVDKLSESKMIKRGAQLTAKMLLKLADQLKDSSQKFVASGGLSKLKQVGQDDLSAGSKIVKEFISYDLFETVKKMLRSRPPPPQIK